VTTLADVDPDMIFLHPPSYLHDRYGDEDPLVKHAALVDVVQNGRVPTFAIPGLRPKLQALEECRLKERFLLVQKAEFNYSG
jgi:amidase